MKTPVTSYPYNFKSSAATDESTPPETPTKTRFPEPGFRVIFISILKIHI
jgi:hypothetical protein